MFGVNFSELRCSALYDSEEAAVIKGKDLIAEHHYGFADLQLQVTCQVQKSFNSRVSLRYHRSKVIASS